jgi:hypothetical protein
MKFHLVALAVLALPLLSACSESESVPEGDAAQAFDRNLRGYEAPPGVVIGKDNAAYWAQALLSGYRETTREDLPGKIVLASTMGQCQFAQPGAGDVVVNIHVGSSMMRTPIFAFSRKDLAKRTKDWIEEFRQLGDDAPLPSDADGDNLYAVDVVVTETEKPVYLVLQSESDVVWNIQAAPNARIAHVAVLANGRVGVANLDQAVPVEFMNQTVLQRCNVIPVREPADYWLFVQNAKDDPSDELTKTLQKNRDMSEVYSRWFARNFGMGSETGVVGLDQASQVLVGPLPADAEGRVPFRPLAGAQVRIATEDYVMASSEDSYRSKHEDMVVELARQMAGGDLESLRPGS